MEKDIVQAIHDDLLPIVIKVAEYMVPGSKVELRYDNGVIVKLEF